MRTFASIAFGVLLSAGLAHGEEKEPKKGLIVHVDAAAAAKLLAGKDEKQRPIIIDVRTIQEFDEGHLKGARQIDYLNDDFDLRIGKLDRNKAYLVHCRSGGRSTNSLGVWKKLGFKRVYHLDGGFLAWQKAKLPVEK
ncbi:MAG: rhodanese-like domain-containing protein [Roseibacillus sp.]|jgi:rhodanese-related sulfurtransferase